MLTHHRQSVRRHARHRGAAAVLAMMFLVIFSSLAASMAIVSQGNLTTADNHLKIQRSLAAAETGMEYITFRLGRSASTILTREGLIKNSVATNLWDDVAESLRDELNDDGTTGGNPAVYASGVLTIPDLSLGPAAPTFTVTFTPHPLAGEDYDSAFYDRPPYDGSLPTTGITAAVSGANELGPEWIRCEVTAVDGPDNSQISRSISMDFKLDKRIPFALLSRSRVMIGQNVMIDGPIGSKFIETHLDQGHPIQMKSDFRGLDPALDDRLDQFLGSVVTNDGNGDNRLDISDPAEVAGLTDPETLDLDGNGYLDEFDFLLEQFGAFDTDENIYKISVTDLESGDTTTSTQAQQLMELIDTFNPDRNGDGVVDNIDTELGYNDGFIDSKDKYAKIRGEIYVTAGKQGWEDGAASDTGAYQDWFQGPIIPGHNKSALEFDSTSNDDYSYEASDFDVQTFKDMASGAGSDLFEQADAEISNAYDPDDPATPQPYTDEDGNPITYSEQVPFGAAYPYDFYDRPVFENMTFYNVKIPKGTNALFKNCKFVGVVFVESDENNTDPNYNYAGMQESDGSQKHPDRTADVDGTIVADTKTTSNNIRFHDCTFDGGVVTDVTQEYTHVRNKVTFTGRTKFKDMAKSVVEDSDNGSTLDDDDRELFRTSTIMSPHYSVEMGTYVEPANSNETVQLSGTIVAGVMDMRGQININGTVLTTFTPQSNTGPVLGETSPQFNTTLGYFSSAEGDLEAELPPTGLGVIQMKYDPTIPAPKGPEGPIQMTPVMMTYSEGGL